MAGALPIPSSINSGTSVADPSSFLRTPLIVAWTTLQPLQVVSTQPTPVLSPDLSSETQVSASSPPAHTSKCASQAGEGREVARTLCVGLYLFRLL